MLQKLAGGFRVLEEVLRVKNLSWHAATSQRWSFAVFENTNRGPLMLLLGLSGARAGHKVQD
jgi:hypothetical protein